MINDDILIKFARKRGYKKTWPPQVIKMKKRMESLKLGFPGIGNTHLDLVEYREIKVGDLFIYDPYIELGDGVGDEAPLMLSKTTPETMIIEGIGCGRDSLRDPDRNRLRWKDLIPSLQIPSDFLVYRVNIKPTLNGGPGYYYFFKSYRDFRY
jgi:hypothetical protein